MALFNGKLRRKAFWRDLPAGWRRHCGLRRTKRLACLQASRPRCRRRPKDEAYRQIANVQANLLDRQFEQQPNQIWIADFTCIWTAGLALRVGRRTTIEYRNPVELEHKLG
jgi:hypothetical protein